MSMMFVMLLAVRAGAVGVEQGPVELSDAGATVVPVQGWALEEPSSSRLVGTLGGVTVRVTASPWQVGGDEAALEAWLNVARERVLRADGSSIVVDESVLRPDGGADLALSWAKGDVPMRTAIRTMPAAGRVVHVTVSGPASADVVGARESWAAGVTPHEPPEPLPETRTVTTGAGFGGALPEGWRLPTKSEEAFVMKITRELQSEVTPERCWTAISPYGDGESRVALTCQVPLQVGVLDEHSFLGEDLAVRTTLFGPSAPTIPQASAIEVHDRLAFLYDVNATGRTALKMTVLPYDQGAVVTWLLGYRHEEEALRDTIKTVVASTTFDGPGLPVHGPGDYVSYAWSYRTGLVLGGMSPFFVALCGFGWWFRPRRTSWEDLADS